MPDSLDSIIISSSFGTLGMVWRETPEGPRLRRLVLPDERITADAVLLATRPEMESVSNPAVKLLAQRIQSFLKGESVQFQLGLVDLGECSEFQRRVLLAGYGIPRGRVSTYGQIALNLGRPDATRAVGTALASNPFPIIIPCHRVIRSDGKLGGFRGGLKMKRALLELEGVEFSAKGKVATSRFFY